MCPYLNSVTVYSVNLGLLLGSIKWQGQNSSQQVQTCLMHSSGLHAIVTGCLPGVSRNMVLQVWMSPQEASLIESHLTPEDTMLEFGAGYSTMWFSQFVKEFYSIEHNETW